MPNFLHGQGLSKQQFTQEENYVFIAKPSLQENSVMRVYKYINLACYITRRLPQLHMGKNEIRKICKFSFKSEIKLTNKLTGISVRQKLQNM